MKTESAHIEECRQRLREKLERAIEYLGGRHLLKGGHYKRETCRFSDTGKFEAMVRKDEVVE